MGAIRGSQGEFRLLEDGQIVDLIAIKKVSLNMESNFSTTYYVGQKVGVTEQSMEGWTGSIDMEVTDARIEDFIDGVISGIQNGVGKKDYAFVITETYDDGSQRAYLYKNARFKYSRENGGLDEKITKKLDFRCDEREILS